MENVCRSSVPPAAGAGTPETVKRRQRSRIANGRGFFPGSEIDGRSLWVRRARELITDHINDLGGIENTSAAEQSIIRRASALTVECERFEERFATTPEGEQVDLYQLDQYRKCVDTLRRSLETIGLERRPRDVNGVVRSDQTNPLRERLLIDEGDGS
jgi:hypothetical protein